MISKIIIILIIIELVLSQEEPESGSIEQKSISMDPKKAKDILEPTSSSVILTDRTFDKKVKGSWLVDFYSPFCGHCQELNPIWENLAKSNPKFSVGKVDCQIEKATCQRFNIRSYPTIIFFNDKKLYHYNGERTVEAFRRFGESDWLDYDGQRVPKPKELDPWKMKTKVIELNSKNFYSKFRQNDWIIYLYSMVNLESLVPYVSELSWKVPSNVRVGAINTDKEKGFFEPIFGKIDTWPTTLFVKGDRLYTPPPEAKGDELRLLTTVDGLIEIIREYYITFDSVPFNRDPPVDDLLPKSKKKIRDFEF